MKCINCLKETGNPKFCSRSCAAIFNNKSFNFPKRKAKEWTCRRCNSRCSPPTKHSRVCDKCVKAMQESKSYKHKTIGDLRKAYINHGLKQNTFGYIRQKARKMYLPIMNICKICGYANHIEICHIKDISSFPDDTLISEINSPHNIVALCPNHHWEFDHGLILLN